ncbi:MAG: alpha-N-acetylglucosaminidase [Sedimentisphaerales bacterium]|nr:alpha-N-acetylglucosaminidase [Sedimentisphaerales bacterium]MBN2843460.1 alpha-N-acetylglucosaminidase [Sedimentisphaerales bacterium]
MIIERLSLRCLLAMLLCALMVGQLYADSASESLIGRILPDHSKYFEVELIPSADGRDVFELETRAGQVIIRGNNGLAVGAGLNWYLKYYCKAHISWCGNQLSMPEPLPAVSGVVRQESPYKYRYTFNYCTYGYSMAFWDWERWEREIDYMALNGINLPLAIVGMECVIREVYRDMGLTAGEIDSFISGPAFLPWFHMGNLDGWGGPLPEDWYQEQSELQKRILARMRELGMKAVLPGFAGHVPAALTRVRPEAKVNRLNSWSGFAGTYVLAPDDPLFGEIGRRYISKLTEMYGTDHYYSADTFNEMDPPTTDLAYLRDISRTVYDSMAAADPEAVWVMQGWLFLHSDFWKQERIDAMLGAVADDKMIILDLFSAGKPQWGRTNAYSGKPWIWCMLHNWGGKQGMYGRMGKAAADLPGLLHNDKAGSLAGIGSSQEGNDINPIVFDHLFELGWHDEPVDIIGWTREYVNRRYGKEVAEAQAAWSILLDELFTCDNNRHGPQGSYLAMRPTMSKDGSKFVRAEIFYDTQRVQQALGLLLAASDELADQETYQHDLVDLARQVMSDHSQLLHADLRRSYQVKDAQGFARAAEIYLQAIKDTDKLLLTNKMFLAGRWLGEATAKAKNEEQAELYQWNARDLITLWGAKQSTLHDYAQRQYGGMMGDFNYTRWQMFLDAVQKSLAAGQLFDERACLEVIADYEERWTHSTKGYATEPTGNPVEAAQYIFDKYVEKQGHASANGK